MRAEFPPIASAGWLASDMIALILHRSRIQESIFSPMIEESVANANAKESRLHLDWDFQTNYFRQDTILMNVARPAHPGQAFAPLTVGVRIGGHGIEAVWIATPCICVSLSRLTIPPSPGPGGQSVSPRGYLRGRLLKRSRPLLVDPWRPRDHPSFEKLVGVPTLRIIGWGNPCPRIRPLFIRPLCLPSCHLHVTTPRSNLLFQISHPLSHSRHQASLKDCLLTCSLSIGPPRNPAL